MGVGEDDHQPADADGMVGAIMRQLLSKDVLHQSMKVRVGTRAGAGPPMTLTLTCAC